MRKDSQDSTLDYLTNKILLHPSTKKVLEDSIRNIRGGVVKEIS